MDKINHNDPIYRMFLDDVWCDLAGKHVHDTRLKFNKYVTLDSLKRTEWNVTFITLMQNRLIMGAFRYGRINNFEEKLDYSYVKEAKKRLRLYELTGNKEFLVDASNMCLLEFSENKHPNSKLEIIDDGEHATPNNGRV